MGCDIHSYAEVRKNGKWEKVGKAFDNPYRYDALEKIEHPYGMRNYDLFAILANVRNGRGFAGCDTGDGFNPISEPRGLPEDCSPEIKKISDDYGSDGHSHSYLTLKELLEYDFSQITKHRGYLTPQGYAELKSKGEPSDWCGSVSGTMIKHIAPQIMDILIEAGIIEFYERISVLDKKKLTWGVVPQFYVQTEWSVTYKNAIGSYFFEKTIPQLQSLGNPKDVRIVFWFDN